MPEQWKIFSEIIPYILAAELLVLCVLQIRANSLLKGAVKKRIGKKEEGKRWKEEVKSGTSEIPVVQFEKKKKQEPEMKKTEKEKEGAYDADELAVLQEMMAEFFG